MFLQRVNVLVPVKRGGGGEGGSLKIGVSQHDFEDSVITQKL